MKRVLVTGASNIGKAGVATIVYKWGQAFSENEIVYDYLMQRGLPELKFQKAIQNKGGRMFTMNNRKKGILRTFKWIETIMKKEKYEVLHINSDSSYIAAAYIHAAKKAGIKNIYVHSHCTQIDDIIFLRRNVKTFLHRLCRPYVCKNTKMFLACSKMAGIWMFGKKSVESSRYKTIYNGVEVDKYLFREDIRKQYRKDLRIEDKFIIGCVGRFSYQKNHIFLLEIFAEYIKKNSNSLLMLVGSGELYNELKKKVLKLGIEEKVMFLGLRNDIPQLLSVMDVMVMPSKFEGLPVTMVEAQMASLPCVVSGNITREAKFTENVAYVEDFCLENWTNAIETMRNYERYQNREEREMSSFNIVKAAGELSEILLSAR